MNIQLNGNKEFSEEDKKLIKTKILKNFINTGLVIGIGYVLSIKLIPIVAFLLSKLFVTTIFMVGGK